MVYRFIATLIMLVLTHLIQAQQLKNLHTGIEKKTLTKNDIREFKELLSIPNISSNKINIRKNVDYCKLIFTNRKFYVQELTVNNQPFLLAERIWNKAAKETALIYLQLDGQPVTPSKWNQLSPFTPVIKEKKGNDWIQINEDTINSYNAEMRIFARAASDAKGPVAMFLKAIDLIDSLHQSPTYNIKVIMDFEEEAGSPNISELISSYKEKLKADFLLVYDGPLHSSNKPTLIFGARGVSKCSLTFWGPKTDLHSGHFGNFIPNPAFMMTELIAQMKDADGRVLIPGYYKAVSLSPQQQKLLSNKYDNEKEMLRRNLVSRSENVSTNYQGSLQYPSLNITGIQVAETGKDGRTIIPSKAIVDFDIRTVTTSDTLKLNERIQQFIKSKGFHILYREPTDEERLKYPKLVSYNFHNFYPPFRTNLDAPISKRLISLFKKISLDEPVFIHITGGSVPIAPFVNGLKIPAIIVPTVNSDNNQHASDENLRLGNFIYGIKLFASILLSL